MLTEKKLNKNELLMFAISFMFFGDLMLGSKCFFGLGLSDFEKKAFGTFWCED